MAKKKKKATKKKATKKKATKRKAAEPLVEPPAEFVGGPKVRAKKAPCPTCGSTGSVNARPGRTGARAYEPCPDCR